MTASEATLSTTGVCTQIKKFGFEISQKIRLYGEEFEVLSEPFPSSGGIAIHVRSQRTALVRVLQLPATVIHRVNERIVRAA